MRPGDHLHLHLPDFDVGGTEQWALAMGTALSDVPYVRTVTAGVRMDAAATAAFEAWRPFALGDIPKEAFVIAPCDIDRLVAQSQRVIAVAHGMNAYYQELFAAGGYCKAVAVSKIAKAAFPTGVDVEVLYNGVDLQRLKPRRSREEARGWLGLAPEAVVVGHVGRTAGGKQPLMAAVAASAVDKGVALYAGPTPDAALITQARAAADCRFITAGPEYPIADIYAAMDVCLIASRSEGFSLVTAEAWATRTPVISTPVGVSLEHPDLVIPLSTAPGAQELADAVGQALDPARRKILDRAQETVCERYTLQEMAQRWRRLLEDVHG